MHTNPTNQREKQDANQASPLPPDDTYSPFVQAFADAVYEKIRATGNVPSDENELLRSASILEHCIRDQIESFAYMAYRDLMEQFPEYKIPDHIHEQYRKTLRIHPRIVFPSNLKGKCAPCACNTFVPTSATHQS